MFLQHLRTILTLLSILHWSARLWAWGEQSVEGHMFKKVETNTETTEKSTEFFKSQAPYKWCEFHPVCSSLHVASYHIQVAEFAVEAGPFWPLAQGSFSKSGSLWARPESYKLTTTAATTTTSQGSHRPLPYESWLASNNEHKWLMIIYDNIVWLASMKNESCRVEMAHDG